MNWEDFEYKVEKRIEDTTKQLRNQGNEEEYFYFTPLQAIEVEKEVNRRNSG